MNSSQTLSGAANSQHYSHAVQPWSCSDSTEHVPNIRVLQSRNRYKTCHVQIVGVSHWLPAIEVDGCYYSFFRVLKSQPEALQTSYRLSQQGDRPVITQIPKGYAVWVLETEVQLKYSAAAKPQASASAGSKRAAVSFTSFSTHQTQEASLVPDMDAPSTEEELLYRVLTSQQQYSKQRVRLPGLDQTILAVRFEENFYSLFKTSHNIKQIAKIVKKVSRRGEKTVVTRMPNGYGVWILEPEAIPVEP